MEQKHPEQRITTTKISSEPLGELLSVYEALRSGDEAQLTRLWQKTQSAEDFSELIRVAVAHDSYLTSLPGSSKTALRKYLASSANLSDLVPLRTIASGQPKHALFSSVLGRSVPALMKMPKYSGIPYDFSPHEVDLGHMAIIGGSGAGKTTMMHMVISMHQKYHPCHPSHFALH